MSTGVVSKKDKQGKETRGQRQRACQARVCGVVVLACLEETRRVGMSRCVSKKDKQGGARRRGKQRQCARGPCLNNVQHTHAHDLNRKTRDGVEWCVPCACRREERRTRR
jgi:hypothetical protein